MTTRSDYLFFGSIKKKASHGPLLQRAVDRYMDDPGANGRKHRLLRNLEVSEAAEALGLTDTLIGLFLANRSLMDANPDQGLLAIKANLLDVLRRELGEPVVSQPAPVRAEPSQREAPAAPRHTSAQPEPAASEPSAAPEPTPVAPAPPRSDEQEPRKSPMGGLMKLHR